VSQLGSNKPSLGGECMLSGRLFRAMVNISRIGKVVDEVQMFPAPRGPV
jgi:hypothetical protein